jgi:hypothetical protein
MKRIILSVVTLVSISLLSQAQFKVGFKAGASQDNQRINVKEGSIFGSDNYKGYHVGIAGDLALGRNWYLQPQLLFSRKGATHLSSTGAGDIKVRMSYVEVPVNILYKLDLPFGKVFGGTGAAFSYAVGGKEQQGGVTRKLYNGTVRDWKRGDVSLTFTAGLEFNSGFFASVNSQKGLMDIHRTDGVSVKNKSMSVSVGYLLDWKKMRRKA